MSYAKRTTPLTAVSKHQKRYLLTGRGFFPDPAFPNEEYARIAWEANREDLIAEAREKYGPQFVPWASREFD